MKRWITALGALAIMSSGCDPIVLSGVVNPPDQSSTGGGASPPSTALAMRAGDWTLPAPDPGGFFQVQLQGTPDPDALVLFFSDSNQECSQPINQGPIDINLCVQGQGFWQLVVVIPPELDHPGLIDLRDNRISLYGASWQSCQGGGSFNSPGASGAGAGSLPTLEIVSSDANTVTAKLNWGGPFLSVDGVDIDGDYTAARCGDAPQASPPLPAQAIPGADLAAPPGGSTPDPDALYLFFGTAADTCEDPWSSLECTGTSRVALRLPPALQKPGIIDLTDPAIAASYTTSRASASSCWSNELLSGTFDGGTIEILSIDASGASFRVYGSYTTTEVGSFDADGLYAASPCL